MIFGEPNFASPTPTSPIRLPRPVPPRSPLAQGQSPGGPATRHASAPTTRSQYLDQPQFPHNCYVPKLDVAVTDVEWFPDTRGAFEGEKEKLKLYIRVNRKSISVALEFLMFLVLSSEFSERFAHPGVNGVLELVVKRKKQKIGRASIEMRDVKFGFHGWVSINQIVDKDPNSHPTPHPSSSNLHILPKLLSRVKIRVTHLQVLWGPVVDGVPSPRPEKESQGERKAEKRMPSRSKSAEVGGTGLHMFDFGVASDGPQAQLQAHGLTLVGPAGNEFVMDSELLQRRNTVIEEPHVLKTLSEQKRDYGGLLGLFFKGKK